MVCDFIEPGRKGMTISVIILGGALLTVMFSYFVFGDTNDGEGLKSLRMIAIIYRHGDRNPTELYANDPNIKHAWPGGLGALSEKGSLQMYNLGKNLRLRYYRLLPQNGLYTKDEMNVQSSAAERCIMSALSFMAGFMPPLENRNPLPLMWQPVAINTVPRDRDKLLAQKRPCPKYDETLKRLYANPPKDVRELKLKNDELFRTLTKNTGENVSTIMDVELLYNILEIEENNGLVLPDWTEDIYPDKMLSIAERSLKLFTETPMMKKVKGGALVSHIHENMLKKRSKLLSPDCSIFVYSGHDLTLANLMNALKISDQTSRKPDYAATIVFEMHYSVTYDDDFEVKLVYYFNSEDKFPKELSIPNCESPCSLTQFSKVIEPILIDDYDEFCNAI